MTDLISLRKLAMQYQSILWVLKSEGVPFDDKYGELVMAPSYVETEVTELDMLLEPLYKQITEHPIFVGRTFEDESLNQLVMQFQSILRVLNNEGEPFEDKYTELWDLTTSCIKTEVADLVKLLEPLYQQITEHPVFIERKFVYEDVYEDEDEE
ncbi:hypothetical protein ACIQYL_20765 [Lysinibacillus xylanilyticus]|uniref:hypothetical protein n=1 Tax=Lysinibacillus xylanilyticus TaxID=582475 RepID=UPI0037F1427B